MCFKTSKDRRKLSLAIARAKEALSASCRVALPVLPGQLRVQALSAWTSNVGASKGDGSVFSTGFSFRKIFREPLLSGITDY